MMIWIAVVVYLVVLVFALALCKAAGDADRRSEIEYLKRQKEKFNMDIIVKEWVSHNEAEIYKMCIRDRRGRAHELETATG